MAEHYPVMLPESLEYLAIRPDGVYLDCTCGLGGHTRAIAERLTAGGKVISNDRDSTSLTMAKEATPPELLSRIEFQQSSFSGLSHAGLNGLLADLGVSRYQLTTAERGFSFMSEGPLDMRMDQTQGVTAEDLINQSAEEAIADWIYQLGEERRARKIARALVRARPIRSTRHLADVVERAVPRTGPVHPATRTFQAFRMVVNREQEELDALLDAAPDMVSPGGRIVIISFMSLEDRKVKEAFRDLVTAGRALLLTKKPLPPSDQEIYNNPPSRSAKLRAIEMCEGDSGTPAGDSGKRETGLERYQKRKRLKGETAVRKTS